MKKFSREIKIGIFGVSMILLLYFGINYIKSKNIFNASNTFYAVYNHVDGLEISSPVMIKGFRVGTVENISFDIVNGRVIVRFSVKNQYPIPDDSKAKITSENILGGKVVEIMLGNSDSFMKDRDTIRSTYEPGLLQVAGDEYSKLKEKASTLVDQLSKVLENVNSLLNDENVANVGTTLANLKSLSGNLDELVTKKRPDIEMLVNNLTSTSESLKYAMPKLDSALYKFSSLGDSLSRHVPDLFGNANASIENLNAILKNIEEGKGTAGRLLNDDELYCRLNNAINDVSLLLQDIKKNPGRYVNISVFGKKTQNNTSLESAQSYNYDSKNKKKKDKKN